MRSIVEHPFPDGLAPSWAVEWGQDEYGVFASFAVKGVVQRMRWIEPGRFRMGSPEDERGRLFYEVEHVVVLSCGYWLADTSCTQALWVAVMGTNPSWFTGEERRPVEQVSWEDCQAFLERLRVLIPGNDEEPGAASTWRLPTEAEWERACRANTQEATWLGDLDSEVGESRLLEQIAWYDGNSGGQTHAVARKPANPLGLHDMLGNVWEWCEDWFAAHEPVLAVDPRGPDRGDYRVLRGGAWDSGARDCRAACPSAYVPGNRVVNLGFRLARGRAPSSGAEPRGGAEGGRRAEPPSGGRRRGTRRRPAFRTFQPTFQVNRRGRLSLSGAPSNQT